MIIANQDNNYSYYKINVVVRTRSSGLAKTILQGTVQGGRRRGKQKKRWEDNISEWTGMTLSAAMRKTERREE